MKNPLLTRLGTFIARNRVGIVTALYFAAGFLGVCRPPSQSAKSFDRSLNLQIGSQRESRRC